MTTNKMIDVKPDGIEEDVIDMITEINIDITILLSVIGGSPSSS